MSTATPKAFDPQAAVKTMWDLAPVLAEAKGNRVYMDEYRKTLKAIQMKASGETSVAAQEREAYASQPYIDHLKAQQAAVEKEEVLRWRMVATQAAIEVWRSQEASNRGIDRGAA